MKKTRKIQWQSGFRQFATICVCLMFITTAAWAETPGDIDGNQTLDLGDSIRGLQVLSESENDASSAGDISGDHKIGIEEVDLQHQYFLDLIKRLSVILNSNVSAHLDTRLINEIIKYAEFHFQSEENLMVINDYPDLEKQNGL